jgi:protein-tyrosine phosphatase
MKLLFVCSGNVCRSPMTAEYFRHRAARSGLSHVVVDSASTLGLQGVPASPEAIRVMNDLGVDLERHRSKALEAADLRSSDLVIVMTRDHLEFLAERFPEGSDRRLLLRAFEKGPEPDPDAPDLDDPMGEPIETYRRQAQAIRRCVDHLILYVRRLTETGS